MAFWIFYLILIIFWESNGQSENYRWASVNITAGGFISGIVFNPVARDVLYVRTDIGGAYRYNPANSHWVPLLDSLSPSDYNFMGIESIGVDPSDANIVYLACGMYIQSWAGNGAILRSADKGQTWKVANLNIKLGGNENGRFAGERLSVDPNHNSTVFFGSRVNGLWRSDDAGTSWSQVSSFPVSTTSDQVGIIFELFDKSSGSRNTPSSIIYAGVSQPNGLYVSKDGGKTWTALPGQPGNNLLPNRAVLSDNGILVVTFADEPGPNGMNTGAVWKYNTKTSAWTDISPVKNPTGGYAGLSVDLETGNTIVVATMDRWNPGDTVFRSTNGGSSWNDIGPKSTRVFSTSPWITFGNPTPSFGWWIGALAMDPFRPGRALYGTGATIWETNDLTDADKGQATSWAIGAIGIEETAVLSLISPPTGAQLISGVGDIGGFVHDNLQVSPTGGMFTNPVMSNVDWLDFAENNSAIVVRVGTGSNGNGAISTNGGKAWTPFSSTPPGSDGGVIAISPDASIIVWTRPNTVPHYSKNRGSSWQQSQAVSGLQVISDRVNTNFYGYDSNTGNTYISRDGGATFTSLTTGLPTGKGTLRAVPGHAGDVWLAAGNSWDNACGLFRSQNGGSFTKLSNLGYVASLGFGKAAPSATYPAIFIQGSVSNTNAIYRSDNTGSSWVRINDQTHQYGGGTIVVGDPKLYGRVYVGTFGRGILYGDRQ